MQPILEQVEAFARKAHGSQRRKFVDEPYINHPIRVMQQCAGVTNDISILSAALLHDVLEDTPVTKEVMFAFLQTIMPVAVAERTLQLVIELTDVYTHAAFPKLNRRVRKAKENERLATTSNDSRTVKYADIIDNAVGIAGDDFAPKLLQEMRVNLKNIPGGDESLYRKATAIVADGLARLNGPEQ
jgi:(p)ppGpp synthase/HD superfamily hydrolase